MLNRRDFIRLGAAASGGAAAVHFLPQIVGSSESASPIPRGATNPSPSTEGATSPSPSAAKKTSVADVKGGERILVVIELAGGNDGINTVVPITGTQAAAYRRIRTHVALPEKDLVSFTKDFALHPSLKRLAARGLAVVGGVGVANPDGSHFEMQRRWATGDLDGKSNPSTGFFGRLADTIGNKDAPAIALGLGSGSSPALLSAWAPTVSLASLGSAELFRPNREDAMLTAFQDGFRRLASTAARPKAIGGRASVGNGMLQALRTAGLVTADHEDSDEGIPQSDLGRSLASAFRLIRQPSLGLRIVHVTHDGFDTHSDMLDQHAQRLNEFDEAVDAFLAAVDRAGMSDRVLVATTSEFGRRAKDNGSNGLDHGAASVALLAGAVRKGMHGEYSSLSSLDDGDNLKAKVPLGDYLATLGTWFKVDPGEIVSAQSKTIPGVLS